MESIAKPIRDNRYNTLSSAYTLLALDAYATATGKEAAGKFSITEVLADGSKKQLKLPEGLMPKVDFSSGAKKLKFASGSDYLAYTVLNQSGFDRNLPEKEIKQEIEVFREYQDANGKPVTSVKLGDEVEVHLSIRGIGKSSLQNVAIVDLLPGGFEIVPESRADQSTAMANEEPDGGDSGGNSNASASEWVPPIGTAKSNWHPTYADVREDRVVLYGTVDNSAQLFVYRIKATNAGTYAVPPTFAEGMYNRGVLARAVGGKITVEGK
jgi:uncharacterized repeat protein (TIGR01451 family)